MLLLVKATELVILLLLEEPFYELNLAVIARQRRLGCHVFYYFIRLVRADYQPAFATSDDATIQTRDQITHFYSELALSSHSPRTEPLYEQTIKSERASAYFFTSPSSARNAA